MKDIYTPTKARQNLFKLIKEANEQKRPIHISPTKKDEKGAVLIGEDDWDSLQETLYLVATGTIDQVKSRENDPEEDFDGAWKSL